MLAHTVKTFDNPEQCTSMLAHTVKTFDNTEQWKEDAFSDMNKNVAAQNVIKTGEPKKTYKIVMIRHGESEWNKDNRFCGWFDSNLSEKGKSGEITFSLKILILSFKTPMF